MIAIRSHSRSAWAMTWVEKMIVAPLAASSRISCSSRPWLIASSPENGSSRTISFGLWTIVPSSWTVCAMPLERLRIGLLAQSPSPFSASRASARARPSRSGRPRSAPMKAIASRAASPDKGRAPRADSRPPAPHRAAARGRAALRLPLDGLDDPEQHPQRRRLAGAVRARAGRRCCPRARARSTPSTARVSPKSLTRSTASTAGPSLTLVWSLSKH